MFTFQGFERRFRFLAGVLACLLAGTGSAMAQSTFGSVLGTVRDSTGAVIAKCVVDIENTGTSAHRQTVTDAAGDYSITNLEPGMYQIKIAAPGFQQFVRDFELTARETVRLDGVMSVAGQVQTVNVEASGFR